MKISYFGLVQPVVKYREEESSIPEGTTVSALLRLLVEKYGDRFKDMMLTSDWKLHPLAMIHLNGRDIEEIDGLETALPADSELTVTVSPYLIVAG